MYPFGRILNPGDHMIRSYKESQNAKALHNVVVEILIPMPNEQNHGTNTHIIEADLALPSWG